MGLFGKKKGLVGLDIGSSAVKAVELNAGGKGGAEFHLVNLGMEPLPPEAIVDGAIMDSGSVIDAIQRLFSSRKIKTPDVPTSLSGNAVIVPRLASERHARFARNALVRCESRLREAVRMCATARTACRTPLCPADSARISSASRFRPTRVRPRRSSELAGASSS